MCSSCGSKGLSNKSNKSKKKSSLKAAIIGDCEYPLEQMESWLEKINCFKENAHYVSIPNMNKRVIIRAIGTLKSAINNSDNICYYRDKLIDVESLITIIISTGLCQS